MLRILLLLLVSSTTLLFLTGCADKKKAMKRQASQTDRNWHDVREEPPQTVVPDNQGGQDTPSQPNTRETIPYTGNGNPIGGLNISSADEINEQNARTILHGMGLMGPGSYHNLSYEAALAGLCNGLTYKRFDRPYSGASGNGCQGIGLNDRIAAQGQTESKTMKEYIFEEYQLLGTALERYSDHPTISRDETPELFNGWIDEAANELTALPAAQRRPLIDSLMTTESGRTHWRNFIPVASNQGAFGFGQFLSRTATVQYNINHYDPGENLKGIAIMLNDRMTNNGDSIREALMFYNGGSSGSAESRTYADNILARVN